MSSNILKVMDNAMTSLNLNYAFMEWVGDPVYPYFIGEYQENEPMDEDGLMEGTFILTGFSRSTWMSLEDAKALIESLFNEISGYTVTADDGSVVALFYASAQPVATGDAELKKIQININIKEWKVNL